MDSELLEERDRLLGLHAGSPDDPGLNYQCAVIHDRLGLEHEAVPFYVRAIEAGLDGEQLRGAYLGLGSTYRAIGEYHKALDTLTLGEEVFPEAEEMTVFKAMTLYNLGSAREAVGLLLKLLTRTSNAAGVDRYRRAIDFYADRLDDTW